MQTIIRQAEQREVDEKLYIHDAELVPAGYTLALNPAGRTLSLLSIDKDGLPHLHAHQKFSRGEMSLLQQLCVSYPLFFPYEDLLAAHHYGIVDEEASAQCRKELDDATKKGKSVDALGSLRDILSLIRLKTRKIGIEITSLTETGYILRPVSAFRLPSEDSHIHTLVPTLLPTGRKLSYNSSLRLLTLLALSEGKPSVLAETALAPFEERVLLCLCKHYPAFASMTHLYASYRYDEETNVTLEKAEVLLRQRKEQRTVRNLVTRLRKKLGQEIGLSITSMLKTGYLLHAQVPTTERRK